MAGATSSASRSSEASSDCTSASPEPGKSGMGKMGKGVLDRSRSASRLAAETRRGEGPNRESRIVSISAADIPDDLSGWPFNGHLTKPLTMQAIQRAIAQPTLAATAPR